jgi:hypothetical protein
VIRTLLAKFGDSQLEPVPCGDLIAYAAVQAADTSMGQADWMSFKNTAILNRRVFLLGPKTGRHWRLNRVEAFQDAPT